MTNQTQRDRILMKAYELWEAEGRPAGRDLEHWLKAEMLIAKASTETKGKTRPAAKAKPSAKPKAPAKAKPKAPAKAKAK
ncbi:MAG: DUF2934 domain-containing protein, partial [Rhodospirillales bacterium]|nr:DUF2934 domain-containing protein [Rhodospirillales bacterium]MCW8951229.1 DUF2934 domain-containing protein [Rhodospirillales bacterium]